MKKLKVGMVGIGRATAYGKIFSENEKTEVTALCDVNSESLRISGRDFGLDDSSLFERYEDFINADIDIVVLGTPIPYHRDQTVMAVESGRHVLCEVTAADSVKSCEDIFSAVKKSKVKYMLAENCNYMHFVMEWHEYVKQGKIGQIHYAEADYVHEIRELVYDRETGANKWRVNRAPIHYCTHSLGPLLMLMDDYIVKATALGTSATIMPDIGIGAIDMQVALFETRKGAAIKVLRSSVASRRPMLAAYGVYGTKGFLESGRREYDNTGLCYYEDTDKEAREIKCTISNPDAPKEAYLGGHGTSEYYLVRDFLEAIESGREPAINVTKAMDMTLPGLIAHEAAMRGGVWLDVPRLI